MAACIDTLRSEFTVIKRELAASALARFSYSCLDHRVTHLVKFSTGISMDEAFEIIRDYNVRPCEFHRTVWILKASLSPTSGDACAHADIPAHWDGTVVSWPQSSPSQPLLTRSSAAARGWKMNPNSKQQWGLEQERNTDVWTRVAHCQRNPFVVCWSGDSPPNDVLSQKP